MKTLAITMVLLSFAACEENVQKETLYNLDVEALDDRGDPVLGIEVSVGETMIGITGKDGHLRARLAAMDGQRFEFHAQCPDGFSSAEIPKEIAFHSTLGLEGKENAYMNFGILCNRSNRVVALLVHADGHSGMPVLIDGVSVGTTDDKGFAHIRLDLKPSTQFLVSLDSSGSPKLLPANPRQSMTLGSEDGLFVFDPVFRERPAPPVKKGGRSRRKKQQEPTVTTSRPIRID